MEIKKEGESKKREKRERENKILDLKFTTCEQWVVYIETYCLGMVYFFTYSKLDRACFFEVLVVK